MAVRSDSEIDASAAAESMPPKIFHTDVRAAPTQMKASRGARAAKRCCASDTTCAFLLFALLLQQCDAHSRGIAEAVAC